MISYFVKLRHKRRTHSELHTLTCIPTHRLNKQEQEAVRNWRGSKTYRMLYCKQMNETNMNLHVLNVSTTLIHMASSTSLSCDVVPVSHMNVNESEIVYDSSVASIHSVDTSAISIPSSTSVSTTPSIPTFTHMFQTLTPTLQRMIAPTSLLGKYHTDPTSYCLHTLIIQHPPNLHFFTYGWCILHTHQQHIALVKLCLHIIALSSDSVNVHNQWIELRGGGEQFNIYQTLTKDDIPLQHAITQLLNILPHLIHTLLTHVGILPWMFPYHRRVHLHIQIAVLKFIAVRYGVGKQSIHFDVDKIVNAQHCIAIIMYLRATKHTAFPNVGLEEMIQAFIESDEATEEQMTLNKQLCDEKRFVSEDVEEGDIAIFSALTAHYGVKNESRDRKDRVFIYILLSPYSYKQAPNQDEYQRFSLGESNAITCTVG